MTENTSPAAPSAPAASSARTGMLPVDDTALAVTDTGGAGLPVIYLNGQFATQSYWRRILADLGDGFRHITYDEQARGKSKRSADYSFETAVRDVDAALAARGVERAIGAVRPARLIRSSLAAVAVRNPHIEISAKVAANHGAILKKDHQAVAKAIRKVATPDARA